MIPMNFMNGGFNPISMLMNGTKNPRDFATNMLRQKMGDNPLVNNAIQMIDSGNINGVEGIVRNFCKSQNIDPNDVLSATQKMFGMK